MFVFQGHLKSDALIELWLAGLISMDEPFNEVVKIMCVMCLIHDKLFLGGGLTRNIYGYSPNKLKPKALAPVQCSNKSTSSFVVTLFYYACSVNRDFGV